MRRGDYVLVVEDDDSTREVLLILLHQRGLTAAGAGHGVEALEHIERNGLPSVALVDLMMPIMDGVTFLRRVRSMPGGDRVPLIAVTAAPNLGRPPEATAFLIKPYDTNHLLELVAALSRRTA